MLFKIIKQYVAALHITTTTSCGSALMNYNQWSINSSLLNQLPLYER